MACTFTREDLQEELRKLSLEIRNLHKNLQQDLHDDLQRLLEDRSRCETPVVTSWLTPSPVLRQRRSTPATTVGFDLGDSVSTDGWRPSSCFSRDTKSPPRMFSKGSNDGSSRVRPAEALRGHPAPAESLRGSAVTGFYIQDAVQPPSCVPDEMPSGKALHGKPGHIFSKAGLGNGQAIKKVSMTSEPEVEVEYSEDESEEIIIERSSQRTELFGRPPSIAQAIGNADSWKVEPYNTRTSQGRRGSKDSTGRRKSVDTISTAQSFDERNTIYYKVYNGEMTCAHAVYLFVLSENFDYFMGVFLFANALSIGVQVEVMCGLRDEGSSHVPPWLRVVDLVFCVVFLAELVTRICIWRREYLRMAGWQWNCFDILVVSFSVIDEISKAFLVGTAVQETIDSMGVLRMLRLARVVRLIRMVRLIPELKSMVYLILSSMSAFFWTLILLTLLIYVVSVYYTEVSIDLILKATDGELDNSGSGASCDESDPTKHIDVDLLKVHYGSIFSSILSLFMAITGGDDWRNFVDLFKPDKSYIINALMFVSYISFVTLVMLNLVTGVFVEGAARLVQSDKEAEIKKNVNKLFQASDTDHSGDISWAEFEAQLETKRMKKCLRDVDMDASQAAGLFKLLDTDRSGQLSVNEFVEGCLRLRVPARSVDLQTLKYDFEEITNHWARQFALIGTQISNISEMVEKLSWATVASLPEELILV